VIALVLLLAPPGEECETCHPGATRFVALSRHAPLENRCTGCHGGDPASTDERRAHEGEFREAPVAACGSCHVAEGEAFAAGPHFLATRTGAMRGCADCHGSHEVHAPSHALFEEVCARCHAGDSPDLVEMGIATAGALRTVDTALARAEEALLALRGAGHSARRERDHLEALRLRRLELLPRQHEMDLDAFGLSLSSLREEADLRAEDAGAWLARVRARRWWLLPVLGVAALNALALGLKRRSLRRIEPDSPPPTPTR
jgi:hypothetical protein